MEIILWLDYIGTMVFAISGVLTAAEKRLDLFGAMVIGMVTAIGGGTLRDLLLGVQPVTWMQGYGYLLSIFLGIAITLVFRRTLAKLRRTLFLFDTIGIAVFTIIGLEKALNLGLNPAVAVLMGVTTAVFGGVTRDTLTNEVPMIFQKEIYATACLAGALCYLLFREMGMTPPVNDVVTIGIIIGIRLVSVRYNLKMPVMK